MNKTIILMSLAVLAFASAVSAYPQIIVLEDEPYVEPYTLAYRPGQRVDPTYYEYRAQPRDSRDIIVYNPYLEQNRRNSRTLRQAYEDGFDDGYDEGYDEGYDDGYDDGRDRRSNNRDSPYGVGCRGRCTYNWFDDNPYNDNYCDSHYCDMYERRY
jgi:hypothetical protein